MLGQGTVGANGEFKVKVAVPDNPLLIGLQVFGQAGLMTGTGTRLTSSDLKQISS